MSETTPTLEELDRDGALQETAERAAQWSTSRGTLLKRAGLGAGVLMVGGAFAGAAPALAGSTARIPQSDVDILNYALTLEYLEAAFYTEAEASGKLRGPAAEFA